jgi:hypothetical protein
MVPRVAGIDRLARAVQAAKVQALISSGRQLQQTS